MNDTADDEVVEVFVEEAGEVFQNIDNQLPVWRRQPTDMNALTEIRRGFHTLKGSGRMVNALDLSEVAWKIENMLNRLIDGSVQFTEPMVELVSAARTLLASMLDAFKDRRPMGTDQEVEALMEQADTLAVGQPPTPSRATKRSAGEERATLELTAIERQLGRSQQRSDEALHRSEMALQHARRITNHLQTLEGEVQSRVGRAEVNRIIERVNLLAREVVDLRRDAKRSQQQPPHPREISQLIDRRVKERTTLIERQRSELARQLEEVGDAVAVARKLAGGALILSILVAFGAIAVFIL